MNPLFQGCINTHILGVFSSLKRGKSSNLKTNYMKKTTQNFTNVRVWQSIILAFIFLLSIPTFSQTCPTDKFNQDPVVGDQLGENVTIKTTSMSKGVVQTIPWSEGLESGTQGDLGTAQTGSATNYNWMIATGHFTHNIGDDGLQGDGGNNYLQHDDVQPDTSGGTFENWVITPTFDLSGAASPELNYWEHVHWQSYAQEHLVMYSTDYVDNGSTEDTSDVTAATWVTLNDVIFDNVNYDQYYSGCGCDPTNAWGESTFALPTESTVTVAFKYVGGFDSDWLIDDISVKDPTASYAEWSVSVAGSDATLSISSIENFNIGNGSSYDGHWHYTLDGGSANMVYDTNDVSLTGLADGEHTIVAWLVDNNHNPLDPEVEETITFTVITEVTNFPYCSSFDTDLEGWDTSIYSGTTDWEGGATANTSGGVTPLSGDGMAFFYSGNYDYDTASIISPPMNLSGATNPTVTFSYTQEEWDWGGGVDQDQLRVFYRNGSGGNWVELAAYTSNAVAWTEVTLDLPSPSDDYYIGFQGTSGYGYGITVDDVCVDASMSVNDSQILDVMIYPNPVEDNYVTITSPVNGLKNIEVFDINGRRVMDTTINNNTLDVSSINSGFYMIKVTIDGQTKISKLVIR